MWPRLASSVFVLGACSTTHKQHTTSEPVVTGEGERTMVVCDTSHRCESELENLKSEPDCGDYRAACRVIEVTGRKESVLLRADTRITPLIYDRTHGIFWITLGGRVLGVTTSASELAGTRVPAPALVADSRYVEETRVTSDRLVLFKLGTTFRIWNPATGRAVEVETPGPAERLSYGRAAILGDLTIGLCEREAGEPGKSDTLWWSTIDIAASLDTGTAQLTSGVDLASAYPDPAACAEAHAQPATTPH